MSGGRRWIRDREQGGKEKEKLAVRVFAKLAFFLHYLTPHMISRSSFAPHRRKTELIY
jgi:hypothetical protein